MGLLRELSEQRDIRVLTVSHRADMAACPRRIVRFVEALRHA
ncbi:MAG TPA: hypothetical protein VFY73_13455 [Ideonella sp.]|nr:hypothetical protein [Ideonella sp.]HEX5685023.1 hypothetical protein [Ideonella sp.]